MDRRDLIRQTAGRTLVVERSSNGKGTRTTLPFIIERSPIGKCVDVLFRIFQEIEGGVSGCCLKPFSLAYVRVFGQQVTCANGFSYRISRQCVTPVVDDCFPCHTAFNLFQYIRDQNACAKGRFAEKLGLSRCGVGCGHVITCVVPNSSTVFLKCSVNITSNGTSFNIPSLSLIMSPV